MSCRGFRKPLLEEMVDCKFGKLTFASEVDKCMGFEEGVSSSGGSRVRGGEHSGKASLAGLLPSFVLWAAMVGDGQAAEPGNSGGRSQSAVGWVEVGKPRLPGSTDVPCVCGEPGGVCDGDDVVRAGLRVR